MLLVDLWHKTSGKRGQFLPDNLRRRLQLRLILSIFKSTIAPAGDPEPNQRKVSDAAPQGSRVFDQGHQIVDVPTSGLSGAADCFLCVMRREPGVVVMVGPDRRLLVTRALDHLACISVMSLLGFVRL